jgi:DNA-binding transcriptional LysR family regulator
MRVTAGDLDGGTSGTLRITTSPDIAVAVLPNVITRYATLHPRVRVEAQLTFAMVDLVAEGVDLALRITAHRLPDSAHLTAARVGKVQLGLYAAPRYLARAGTPRTVAELVSYDLVGLEGPGATNDFGPRRIAADDGAFVHAVLRAGGGIGVLPTYLAREDLATGTLVRVVPEWTSATGTVWLLTPHGKRPPRRVTAFREVLVEALAQHGMLEPTR